LPILAVAYLAGLLTTKLRQARVQLKHASGALENLQILHENIIQSISSGLITTGLDGHITLVEQRGAETSGAYAGSVLGTPVSKLFLDALPNAESQEHAEVRFDAANGFRKTCESESPP
jgi:two-component system, NtrC family, sensor histidine kinase PilS